MTGTRTVMDNRQLAEHFGVAVSTIYQWRDHEGLPFHRVGRTVRYSLDDVTEWFARYKAAREPVPAVSVEAAPRRRRRMH